MNTVPLIHREILVDADPDTAFEVIAAAPMGDRAGEGLTSSSA